MGNSEEVKVKNSRELTLPRIFGGDEGARTHDLSDVNRTL